MHRLFVAFLLPEPLIEAVAPAMEGGPEGIRWVPEDDLHCTLRFIGEIERPMAEDVAEALQGMRAPSLEVHIDGVGVFDHQRHGALFARLAPKEPLRALHDKVDRALQRCGLQPERRAYLPHITLARWSGGPIDAQPWAERWAGLSSNSVRLDHFTLFESRLSQRGPSYTAVLDQPLVG
ncbi:RNA 2',3'-cyclic phosphodiesterase [Sphingomicrobium arenosum]|uniref:RNA 2',3'-cyclic phosphodiesterase n=1 Tax=Sphingomicrobium arenosum TaxID=2233861 RepID=UPI00223EB0B5|nr:RNA 2',3'-cyclic phosphodiesterase [Sphingomicrobium arenosum]